MVTLNFRVEHNYIRFHSVWSDIEQVEDNKPSTTIMVGGSEIRTFDNLVMVYAKRI